jgi:hypothetical protein
MISVIEVAVLPLCLPVSLRPAAVRCKHLKLSLPPRVPLHETQLWKQLVVNIKERRVSAFCRIIYSLTITFELKAHGFTITISHMALKYGACEIAHQLPRVH